MRRGELAKQDVDQGPNFSLFLFIGTMSKRKKGILIFPKNRIEVLYLKRLAPMKWRNE